MRKNLSGSRSITPNRREFLKIFGTSTTGASLFSSGFVNNLFAQNNRRTTSQNIITRKIPRTGEEIPAIGLGTFMTFDVLPGGNRFFIGEVLKRFYDGGGRLVDTSPLYGTGETSVGDYANALGITNELLIADKIWTTGDFLADSSHAKKSLEQSQNRLWREKFDVLQVHSLVNVDAAVPLINRWKKEGLVKYCGVTHHEVPYFDALADWIEKGSVDFVQVHYSIHTREAEKRILPAARDKGVAVLVNMPFEKARLFEIVKNRPLPDFVKDFGAENWAQFFLKWIISNPVITCAIPATTNPDHQTENISALRGALPDQKMRERMVKFMESIPGFNDLAKMPWYPGKTFNGIIKRAQSLS